MKEYLVLVVRPTSNHLEMQLNEQSRLGWTPAHILENVRGYTVVYERELIELPDIVPVEKAEGIKRRIKKSMAELDEVKEVVEELA